MTLTTLEFQKSASDNGSDGIEDEYKCNSQPGFKNRKNAMENEGSFRVLSTNVFRAINLGVFTAFRTPYTSFSVEFCNEKF